MEATNKRCGWNGWLFSVTKAIWCDSPSRITYAFDIDVDDTKKKQRSARYIRTKKKKEGKKERVRKNSGDKL